MIKMPKLLDFLKEKGYTHEAVMELIEKNPIKPDTEEEVEDEPVPKEGEIDKPEGEVEEAEEETEKISDEVEEEEKAKITELVQEEVVKQLKIKRKTPSKGKLKTESSIEYGVSNRGYEELV